MTAAVSAMALGVCLRMSPVTRSVATRPAPESTSRPFSVRRRQLCPVTWTWPVMKSTCVVKVLGEGLPGVGVAVQDREIELIFG
jgi:hypothetical protein